MNGALKMASSRIAITAALGLALGAGSAQAADLGGNCCADLEERVAELEATTARKGNRKMSLTVTGQVNKLIMWYDDGQRSDVYFGLDNTNSSTRFSFIGEAKVTSKVSIGFDITVEHDAGAASSSVNQGDEDAGIAGYNANQGYSDDTPLGARRMEWWIEHKDVGRMSVGRMESAGVVTTIDLGGIGVIASSSYALIGGSLFLRSPAGAYYTIDLNSLTDPADAQGRTELLRYDSPAIAGFVFSASVGEAGDQWGAMLRYAGEFSGFRVAAGIGYESIEDPATLATGPISTLAAGNQPDITAWGGSVALMHVPSGLFVQGQYMKADFDAPGNPGNSTYWGDFAGHVESELWQIQAGIRKNWTGLGDTSIYGEYANMTGWAAARDWVAATTATDFTNVFGVTDSEMDVWGLGIVQNIDAAATELYLGWRHYSPEITCSATAANCAGAAGATVDRLDVEDIDVVAAGARVKF